MLTANPVSVSPALPRNFSADALQWLELHIERSYAHNSLLYAFLAESADLETITHFLRWDAAQPSFATYLRRWLGKIPEYIRHELEDHVAVEENERHSELFQEMMAHLDSVITAETRFDEARLEALNYTFSEQCAREEDIGFFLGGFWATEIMSAKRCLQLHQGLVRNGVPASALVYMRIHFEADASHGDEVKDKLIVPMLARQPELISSIQRGVHDRLSRSTAYLMWYELERLAAPPWTDA